MVEMITIDMESKASDKDRDGGEKIKDGDFREIGENSERLGFAGP